VVREIEEESLSQREEQDALTRLRKLIIIPLRE
jgi:hypothetical protein